MTAPGTGRRGLFGAVSTALRIGHGLVVAAVVAGGIVYGLRQTDVPAGWTAWSQPPVWWSFIGLHFVLMLATPLWSRLAAAGQSRVSRLWAWLGYFIPVAGYWLPARTLRGLTSGAPGLGPLIAVWAVARGLAGPAAMIVACDTLTSYQYGRPEPFDFSASYIYLVVAGLAANLLSLVMIGGVRRHLTTATIHQVEVFA